MKKIANRLMKIMDLNLTVEMPQVVLNLKISQMTQNLGESERSPSEIAKNREMKKNGLYWTKSRRKTFIKNT